MPNKVNVRCEQITGENFYSKTTEELSDAIWLTRGVPAFSSKLDNLLIEMFTTQESRVIHLLRAGYDPKTVAVFSKCSGGIMEVRMVESIVIYKLTKRMLLDGIPLIIIHWPPIQSEVIYPETYEPLCEEIANNQIDVNQINQDCYNQDDYTINFGETD